MSFCIYVLKLANNKYYIGKTKNINNRLLQHFENNGSVWTKKYKPIEIIQTYKNCESLDEDKYTIKYMAKYGIDNVRGGIYCQINLNYHEKQIIKRSISAMNDTCYRCGSSDHFISNCKKMEKKLFCSRCKRNSHNIDNCYAKTFINGKKILSCEELEKSKKIVTFNNALKKLSNMFPTININIIKNNLIQSKNMNKTIDFLILYKKNEEEKKQRNKESFKNKFFKFIKNSRFFNLNI
jgi:predicted GIY-YIG superfamily endonuclease